MFLSVSMFLAMGPMTTETVWAAESAENVIESGLSVKWGGVDDTALKGEEDEFTDAYKATDISSYLTVNSSGVITAYSGTDIEDILIPSEVDGVTVTGIGDSVFSNHTEIASVQFPATLKSIGNSAFSGAGLGRATRAGNLVIPSTIDTIGINAFRNCAYLGTVTFEDYSGVNPEAIQFESSTYYGNDGSSLFRGCSKLTSITLSNRVIDIPMTFAADDTSLEMVSWTNTLETIGTRAFEGDTKLTGSDFSQTQLKTIGESSFKKCSTLEAPVFPNTLKTIGNNAFNEAGLGQATRVGNLTIPSGVDTIGLNAFLNCAYLGTVTFENYPYSEGEDPVGIQFESSTYYGNDGSSLFRGCSKLTSITLSNRVIDIPMTFATDDTNLGEVLWNTNLKTIGERAFSGDTKLTGADFSETELTTIGVNSFNKCSILETPLFPDTLKTIGGGAFDEAGLGKTTQVGDLFIPSSVDTIGVNAFRKCPYLGTVTFENYTYTEGEDPVGIQFESSTYYGNDGSSLFRGCTRLTSITLSNRVVNIPMTFAADDTNLSEVKWNTTLKTIGERAFVGNTKLTGSDFSQTELTAIGANSFNKCSILETPLFPGTLKTIGGGAFDEAGLGKTTQVGDLVIPSSVDTIGVNAFRKCPYLGTVTFENFAYAEGENPVAIQFESSIYYGNDGSSLFRACPRLTSITLSNRVINIPTTFAAEDTSLSEVKWNTTIQTIGERAFAGDTKLVDADFSSTDLKTVGGSAFSNCSSLALVQFPETLATIGNSAFQNAALGTRAKGGTVVIPSDVTSVGASAFAGSPYLRKLVIGADNGLLDGMTLGASLLAGCGYLTEIELSGRIQKIPNSFANNCASLSHLTVSDNKLESVGSSAFYINKKTDIVVTSSNSVINSYNWEGDNRNLANTAVIDVVLNTPTLDVKTGETKSLTATVSMYPASASKPALVWRSSNEATATVEAGRVTGVSEGTAIISATVENSVCQAGSEVTVTSGETPETEICTVTFDSRGGSEVPQVIVTKGEKAKKPADPTRENYTFKGWYLDEDFTIEHDFESAVNSDLTLYAKWEENQGPGPGPELENIFTLKKDSNHFANSGSNFFNSGESRNYQFKDRGYFSRLSKVASTAYEKNSLTSMVLRNWGGSCYGIAATIGLVLTGRLKVNDLSDDSYQNYHSLPQPRLDERIFDSINFYQSGQLLDAMYSKTLIDGVTSHNAEDLKTFLRALVESTENNNPVLLTYFVPAYGHAILALNSEKDEENHQYIVTLYDENTASGDNYESERFTQMTVAEDFSSFDYTPVGEIFKLQNVYKSMQVRDLSKFPLFTEIGSAVEINALSEADNGNFAVIDLPANVTANIKNGAGEILSLQDGENTGTMEVKDVQYLFADDASRIQLTVDPKDSFTITTEDSDLDVFISTPDQTMGIDGESVKEATLSLKTGEIAIAGDSYSFDAFIQGEDSDTLLSVSADATGNTRVSAEGNTIKAVSDGALNNPASVTYEGNESKVEEVKTSGDSEIEATHEKTISRSGMDPQAEPTANNELYLVKGQNYELSGANWKIEGSTKALTLSSKKGVFSIVTKSPSTTPITVTNGTITYKVYVAAPALAYENGAKKASLVIGDTAVVKIGGIEDADINKYPVSFTSNKPQIATVSPASSENGKATVTAVGKGSATITAYIGGKTYSCSVSVSDDAKNVPKAAISGSADLVLSPKQTVSLKYSGFTAKAATWTSEDHVMNEVEKDKKGNVVTVSNGIVSVGLTSGKITAVGSGETTIKGTDTNDRTVILNISVKPLATNPVSYVKIGKTVSLKAPKLVMKATKWEIIAGGGLVEDLKNGKFKASALPKEGDSEYAEILCTFKPYEYGNGFTYTFRIYPENPSLKTDGGLTAVKAAQYSLSLQGNNTYSLKEQYNGICEDVVWKSSKPELAYVDENGVVHANRTGKTGTTKLTTKVGGVTLTVTVTVTGN